MKKLVITGGGTGGHAIPALSVAEYLKNEFDIYFIGSKNGIEKELVKKYPYIKYYEITTCKLIRSFSFKNLLIPFKLIKSVNECKKILKQIKPCVLFSKGGFVSVPVVFASKKLNIPVISHESDLSLGLANKINLKYSKYMCCSFEKTSLNIKNGIYSGSPIRKQILNGNKYNIINKYSISMRPSILILGGSLGSKNLNHIVRRNLDTLTKNFNVIHICGKGNKENVQTQNYYQFEFVDNIEDFYDLADIVISRSGSNVIFELLALKKPMILLPLQKGSRGDQVENAEYFKERNLATVLYENSLTDEVFIEKINETFKSKNEIIKNMNMEFKDALKIIANLIKQEANNS